MKGYRSAAKKRVNKSTAAKRKSKNKSRVEKLVYQSKVEIPEPIDSEKNLPAPIVSRGYRRKSASTKLVQSYRKKSKVDVTPSQEAPSAPPKERRIKKSIRKPTSFWEIIGRPFEIVIKRYPILSLLIVSISALLFFGTWATYHFVFENLPDVHELTQRPLAASSNIVDRNGELLYSLYDDENRTIIPLNHISSYLIQATISIEDQTFFTHQGFSPKGIARAVTANFQGDAIQGGSTITQQLVKNRLLSNERTYTRKLRELVLAIMVEKTFSKEQILEMYLNTVAYGGSTYGIEAAAQRYFNKPAEKLTLAESALIAGLPQAPSVYSPFGSNPELAKLRQQEVLRRMVEDGYITAEQSAEAQHEELVYNTDATQILAPHFVMYVRQLLADRYGEEMLTTGGLTVKTTLDLALQNSTQKIVTDEISSLKRLRIKNGAALVTNPNTGEVLAMVGSVNYFDFSNDGQVNVVLRPRQPGSSIKPLTYSLALENGMTVTSTIEDSPVSYSIAGSPPYAPKNYDGKYHGRVTLKEALASSYNIPAVKLLAMVGINNEIDRAEAMGITTWGDRSRFGLSLTLGGGEVRMIDLATLYGVFANQGYRVDPNPILEVTDGSGAVLYRNECALEQKKCPRARVTDPGTAFLITSILDDNKARTPAFGPISTLYIPGQQVAVKTGTTNSLRDNWTVGYTSDRVVAVWVGNNDNTPMSYVASGITGASPIWNKIIRTQLDEKNPHVFVAPPNVVEAKGCGTASSNFYIVGTEPKNGCPTVPKNEVQNPR
ncbi:PBP1A family penicillin-binding protein [Candidatus Woesebacteria bacterium]|nr:PBP1A family penicillin-binding protein [Candidatus Woesebacteria bacterium]